MAAAQRRRIGQIEGVIPVADRHRDHWPSTPPGNGPAPCVIHTDHAVSCPRNEPLLYPGVILNVPVTVKVIGCDVQQNTDVRGQLRRQVDLVRGAFHNEDATVSRICQFKHGRTDIAT